MDESLGFCAKVKPWEEFEGVYEDSEGLVPEVSFIPMEKNSREK